VNGHDVKREESKDSKDGSNDGKKKKKKKGLGSDSVNGVNGESLQALPQHHSDFRAPDGGENLHKIFFGTENSSRMYLDSIPAMIEVWDPQDGEFFPRLEIEVRDCPLTDENISEVFDALWVAIVDLDRMGLEVTASYHLNNMQRPSYRQAKFLIEWMRADTPQGNREVIFNRVLKCVMIGVKNNFGGKIMKGVINIVNTAVKPQMPVRSIVETPSLFEEQRAFFLEIKPTGAPSMDRPKEKSKRKISFGAGRTERRNTPDGLQSSANPLSYLVNFDRAHAVRGSLIGASPRQTRVQSPDPAEPNGAAVDAADPKTPPAASPGGASPRKSDAGSVANATVGSSSVPMFSTTDFSDPVLEDPSTGIGCVCSLAPWCGKADEVGTVDACTSP
jgi:hypothetical protein